MIRTVPIALATALASIAVAGCRSPIVTPPQPQVEMIRARRDVVFAPGDAVLSAGAVAELRASAREGGVEGASRAYVLRPQGGLSPGRESLDARRARAVAAVLEGDGVSTEVAFGSAASEAGPDAVAVIFERASVVLPPCPNWTSPPNSTFTNQPMSNWGCATAVNFGMMVANPNDLVRGQSFGPADGEVMARSVQRYREGRTRDLIRDSASSEIFPTAKPSEGGK